MALGAKFSEAGNAGNLSRFGKRAAAAGTIAVSENQNPITAGLATAKTIPLQNKKTGYLLKSNRCNLFISRITMS